MSNAQLGEQVCLGLLAGPEELRCVRETRNRGVRGRVWWQMEKALEAISDFATAWSGLCSLAFAAAVAQREDWAQQAVQAALKITQRAHWLHPEAGVLNLEGMHLVHHLALLVDWLWPVLSQHEREALLGAIVAKGVENLSPSPEGTRDPGDGRGQLLLARRMDREDPHCLHPQPWQVNNWDLWFGVSLQLAAALVERAFLRPGPGEPPLEWGRHFDPGYDLDADRVARWKAIARERIDTALATKLGPDGDYAEGLAYAGYGGVPLVTALLLRERLDGEDFFSPAALALPAWARNQYPADLPFGAVNFNDTKLSNLLTPAVLALLARRSGDPRTQGIALEALDLSRDQWWYLLLLGLDPDLPSEPVVLPEAMAYQHTGEVVWRTAQDRSGVFFAMQCGAHGGAHQHRDRGNFFLSAYGEHLLVEQGDSRYAKPHSDPPTGDTRGHNCLLIDGREQVGDNKAPRAGRLLEHRHEAALSTALVEATDCYENVNLYRRRVVFCRPDLLVVADRVEGEVGSVSFLLQGNNGDGRGQWNLRAQEAVFRRPRARVHVFFLEPVSDFSVCAGTLEAEPRGLQRLETLIRGGQVTAVLVPCPAEEEGPIGERRSGALTVRWRGREWRVEREGEAVTVQGRSFAL